MSPNLQKILLCLKRSELDAKEQRELFGYFALADDRELAPVVGLLSESPKRAGNLLHNIRAKCKAFATKDKQAWTRILEEEVTGVEALMKGLTP